MDKEKISSGFVPTDDDAFERELYERQKKEAEENRKRIENEKRLEEERRASYEKDLADKKIELMKLKMGVIEKSDVIKEEKEEQRKLTFGEELSNIWYRSKYIILFVVFCVLAFGYIIIDGILDTDPDLTVLVISDNYGYYARTEEFESYLERYCDDLNGDGEVYVMVYNISTDYSDPNTASANQAQLMSQLQTGDNIMVISDVEHDFVLHDFRDEYQSDRFTEKGINLNCALTRDLLKWEAMPENVYVGLREPTRLFSTKEEVMIENYNTVLPMFERMVADILASEK